MLHCVLWQAEGITLPKENIGELHGKDDTRQYHIHKG